MNLRTTHYSNSGNPGSSDDGGDGDNSGGDDDDGGDDDNDQNDNGGDNNPANPSNPGNAEPNSNLLLARAMHNLNIGLCRLHPSSTKVKEPKSFDGTNPNKLQEFLVSCSLVFSNHPDSF